MISLLQALSGYLHPNNDQLLLTKLLIILAPMPLPKTLLFISNNMSSQFPELSLDHNGERYINPPSPNFSPSPA